LKSTVISTLFLKSVLPSLSSWDEAKDVVGVNCPKKSTERRKKENKISVEVNTGITAGTLKCVGMSASEAGRSSGMVALVNEKRTITCTQELNEGRTDFRKSVDITVDFNYLNSAEKQVLVKHLIG